MVLKIVFYLNNSDFATIMTEWSKCYQLLHKNVKDATSKKIKILRVLVDINRNFVKVFLLHKCLPTYQIFYLQFNLIMVPNR